MVAAVLLAMVVQVGARSWSFDDGAVGWKKVTYSGTAEFSVSGNGRSGGCVVISSEKGADASWSFDAPVEAKAFYRLSGWVKTEGVKGAMGALFNVHQVAGSTTKAVTGDSGWTQVSIVFRSGGRTSVQVNCLFGGWGQSTGRAYYDDVRLEKIDMKDFPGPVTIDVTKTRDPISKYIYGQFIEHLGRCIYGGIWAEILEDRKIYYPIEGKPAYEHMKEGYDRLVASPWTFPHAAPTKQVQDEFRDQPVIRLEGIIYQSGLSTVAGRNYTFRVTYKGEDFGCELDGIKTSMQSSAFFRQSKTWTTITVSLHASETKTMSNATFYVKADASIAAVSLMPADNVDGFRRDTIDILKQLNAPIYRWPGGNFVSGYEWRDGIGDPDKRPTRPNPAWTGIDTNDMGINEFMQFCKLVGAEPLVVVNTGFGGPQEAADEVEYCNGTLYTTMGALRAANGHEEPFGVHWWGIGNEMYGGWQLGHIPVAQYVVKHNKTVERMRTVDPTIACVAVGDTGAWDEAMLPKTWQSMDLLSEHIYVQSRDDTVEHTRLLPEAIRRKAEWHRQNQPLLGIEPVKISMDEWNYWYGPYLYGELGTRYYWKDGMGVAAGLHEFFRNTDVFEMAQYAQTVNVIGAVKTTPTAAEFATTGLVLMMYRKYFGVLPVSVSGIDPDLGLDVSAALTADRKTLTIAVVNPYDREMTLPLSFAGQGSAGAQARRPAPQRSSSGAQAGWLAPQGILYTVQNDDPMAYNEPGVARRVDVKESPWADTSKLVLPKYSVTIARVEMQ